MQPSGSRCTLEETPGRPGFLTPRGGRGTARPGELKPPADQYPLDLCLAVVAPERLAIDHHERRAEHAGGDGLLVGALEPVLPDQVVPGRLRGIGIQARFGGQRLSALWHR